MSGLWRRLVGDRPIVTRLVLAVAVAMTVVLLVAGGFVFWRVQYALDRQLDQDLRAYQEVVQRAVASGATPPSGTPGQSYQTYDANGRVTGGNTTATLLVDAATVAEAVAGAEAREDVGRFYPPATHPYRVVTAQVDTSRGAVVVASAISKSKHDEALRELLLQLSIADLATLAAASLVGYGTARAALNPVERYRRAADSAGGAPLLPVAEGKDDEVTRLGHTFNALLRRIGQANERERQFLADASHELRSPLALMRTELEVASLRPRGELETRASFESLRRQVERLITLSNALLELEELRASGVAELQRVDLDRLLEGVAARESRQAVGTGRTIAFHPSGIPEIGGHRRWLEVAVGNLVANALRYGEGTVLLTAQEANGVISIEVSDAGTGFPEEFVEKAFDRFSRAETSRTTTGTGLGLSLVRAVAQAHGGSAAIRRPATVALTLPRRDAPSAP